MGGRRWQEMQALVEERQNGPTLVPPTPVWSARVERGVDAALCANSGDVRQGLQHLYEAVRERVTELKRSGARLDETLMAIKRDVARHAVDGRDPSGDPGRVAGLLDAVVRWCVGAYYLTN